MPVSRILTRRLSDEQLVAQFRAGREDAFAAIHERYRERLSRYAGQMLLSRGDGAVDDVVQDVFLRAYRALRADERAIALRPWLYRIAHNRALDELRPQPTSALHDDLRSAADPAAEAGRRQHLRQIVEDIQRLPAQQRSALIIRELGGLSYAEMAEALDTTVPAIKSLLVRARVNLAEAAEARERAAAEAQQASARRTTTAVASAYSGC